MDLTRITTFCFVASYAVALSLEAVALAGRLQGRVGEVLGSSRRLATIGFAAAGLFAHAVFLTLQAKEQAIPLSSPKDWYLIASLVLAGIYMASTLTSPRWASGVFLLPIVLLLIFVASTASSEPFSPDRASIFWGQLPWLDAPAWHSHRLHRVCLRAHVPGPELAPEAKALTQIRIWFTKSRMARKG